MNITIHTPFNKEGHRNVTGTIQDIFVYKEGKIWMAKELKHGGEVVASSLKLKDLTCDIHNWNDTKNG